ncbi:YfhO family protein [Hallella seregens]|uniref:YfhO family protein n=1 Tax=Hallella seregens ATCC 51272 TaxID=1336250 RepID=A0ABV5ZG38_9BACT|nr:YfhO family protein [Hallella seregens]
MGTLKRCLPDVLAIVLFAVISFVYFMPADLEGRILYQHDSSAGRGSAQEARAYQQQTGERTRWSNATFSGMPTYQTAPSYNSTDVLSKVITVYHLGLPDYVWYVFAYLLGFYILLRAFNFREYLAVLGSVIWAFSSYFFIIIAAGHIWKVMALAYLPPMIGGLVLAYRGKFLWGFIVTAIFTAFEVNANHVQMTYYYLFIILFMVIAWLVQAIRERRMARFWKASLVAMAGAAIGICINLSNLYHTWQYSQESMRGKSELVKKNAANQTSSGLDRDYITQWSYGIGETWTLLVPNVKGGASVPMSQNRTAMEKADPNFVQAYQQIGQYWGEQPGTSGPVYVGAFVLMLFVLGLFIVKGPMKWALLAATVLSVLLSWGRNFMDFTNFFLDYVPMYAKFRTVASILVIAEFTIPLLAMLALKKIVDEPEILKQKARWLYLSFALTGGFALLFWLAPGLFFPDYISTAESQQFAQIAQQGAEARQWVEGFKANLVSVRKYIFAADALRSLLVILAGSLLLWLYRAKRLNAKFLVGCIALLCLVDMWQVNKRYLNDGMFVEKSVRDTPQPMTATDQQILKDKGLDYRVLNLASNTFNENETSYYHKSIGGYHAAKLRRYQEMIDAYISPEMRKMIPAIAGAGGDMTKVNGDSIYPVINMLNAKYIIMGLQNGQTVPIQNPYAYGNAWFVDKVDYVDNANAEIAAVGKINLRHEAVADKRFAQQLGQSVQQGSMSMATLKTYAPNALSYEVNSDKGGVLVFSEVYYPGWTATVDGQPAELGRVNYILRAINLKPGKHTVALDFHPSSIRRTETVAYAAYGLLAVLMALGLFFEWKKNKGATAWQKP